MPEIPESMNDFAQEAKNMREADVFPSGEIAYGIDAKAMDDLIEKFDKQNVHYGSESVVVDIDGEPTKVYAFTYENLSPEKAKHIFYVQRILTTLYPHNFPHFHAAFGTTDEQPKFLTGTIRQKIEGTERHKADKSKIIYPFPDIYTISREMGIPINIDGAGRGDLVLAADGGIYYLDRSAVGSKKWDLEKAKQYMKDKYQDTDISIVTKCIKRLQANGIIELEE